MDSKQPNSPQQEPEKKITHVKEKKNRRRGMKKLLSETNTEAVMEIPHKPYQGEKLRSTIRKDRKFDPKQAFYARRPL